MEYYNVFSDKYVEVVKRDVKCPVTKIQILDHNEFVMYEITKDIVVDSDNITSTYAQGTQSKCSFEVIDIDGKYVPNENSPFWYNKKIKIWKGYKDLDTNDYYWFSQGLFVVSGVSASHNKVSVSGVDKYGMFSSEFGLGCLSANFKLDKGITIKECFERLLRTDMGNGKLIDPAKPIIDPRLWTETLGEDIEVNGGGYFGDIMTEIATAMRAYTYYDNEGHLRVDKGTTDYLYQHKGQSWEFNDHKTAEYLSASADYSFANVINCVDIYGEDFEGTTYFYTAENNNPKSPTNISKIGKRYGGTVESLLGYSQENVEFYGKTYIALHTIQSIGVKIETVLLPHLKVADVVVVTDGYYGWDKKRFMINEISISGGKETLSLVDTDALPYSAELSST